MRRRWSVLLVCLALVGAACSKKTPQAVSDPVQVADGEPWTVLVYSMADTDLEPFMVTDINELGEVGSSEDANFVALVDRAAGYGNDPLLDLGGYTGAALMQVNEGSANVLETYEDLNTGDPAVLADFIAQGVQAYPAGHVALIISDHGASWPGVGADESAGHDSLSLAEIEAAIADGLEGAGIDKLDLLGFDACLMATYEVASTLAPYADRLVASQELEPGHGWDYRSLQLLVDQPGATADSLATELLEGFQAQAAAEGTGASITLSSIDLTRMGELDAALASFTGAVEERAADLAPVIGKTRAQTLGFGRSPDPTMDTHMTDLGTLVSQIGVDALDVSDEADALTRALNDVVLGSVEGPATSEATGLSIYFPPVADYFNGEYANAVETDGDWIGFLESYYGAGEEIPEAEFPEFTDPGGEATVEFDEDGVTMTGTFDLAAEDNLAEATISYGLVQDDGSVIFIGEEPATIAEDGSGLAIGTYDLTALNMTDGEDTAIGYISLLLDDALEVATFDIPMAYYAPDDVAGETYQDVLLELTVDLTGEGSLENEVYYAYDEESGTYGELFAQPRGIIVPQVLQIAPDGTETWEPTTDVGLYANLPTLLYDFEELEPGTELFLQLTVTDFGGNSDAVTAQVTVP